MTPVLPTTDLLDGRYRLERLLGHGGMSDVYRATDETGGPDVAVKLVRSTDPELARRLTQEADAVASLDHPGLVRVLDAGVHRGQPYLVMELVQGPTLAARLSRGPLPTDRCAALGRTLAEALAYVHQSGIVHRDVKPGNVLLGPGPRARLADFGIAQIVDASSLTMTGTTLGTAAYMAPEQLDHHRVGPAADVWSLGAILLECITGARVYEGAGAEVVARRLRGELPSVEHLPGPWRILLGGMLARDPAARPAASEVAEMLAAPAYRRPWTPVAAPEAGGGPPSIAADAGGAAAGLAGAALAGSATTAALGGSGNGSAPAPAPDDPTRAAIGPPTMIGPPPVLRRAREHGLLIPAVISAVVVLVAGLLAWALSGPASSHASTPPKASSTTTTSTSTTTTAPTASTASAQLVRDVQQAESSGGLNANVGRTILDQLGQALAASAQGDSQGVSDSLGAIDNSVANAAQSGQMSAATASTLSSDVAVLAGALGVPTPTTTAPSASQDTQTQPAPAPPKHGH